MRLIDISKLKKIEIEHERYDYCRGCMEGYNDCIEDLETVPEVKAIPIEWIKKYIEDHTYEMVNPKYVDDTYNYIQFTEKPFDYYLTTMPFQVKVMLKEWEKENE